MSERKAPPRSITGVSRRALIRATTALGLAGPLAAAHVPTSMREDSDEDALEDFPLQPPQLAARIVGKSHSDASGVAELLEARPDLAKAAIDWGFGDWETALGAASHVGRRDIAELLISHGARPDLFTMAMLGWTDAVRAAIEAQPEVVRIRGPHGFTLAHHARAGGDEAASTAAYLATVDGADVGPATADLPDVALERCIGRYRFGDAPDQIMVVELGRRGPMLRREGGASRRLLHASEGVFRPAGADGVTLTFTGIDEGPARSIAVHAPAPVLVAQRL